METLPLRFTVSYAWALGCAALHVVAAFILRPRLISRLELLSKKEARALPNLVVAAVHAMTLFVASMRHLRAYWSQDAGVLLFAVKSVTPMAPAEAFWCCAMIGYLLYDTGLVILNGADEGFDMAAHHVLGLVSWGSLRLTDYGGIYLMWVHLAEGSTPWLHLCTALYNLQLSHTAPYKFSALMLVVLFTLTRTVSSTLCLASLWTTRALWGPQVALFYFNLSITAFFVALNYVWWVKLLRRAFGRGAHKVRDVKKTR